MNLYEKYNFIWIFYMKNLSNFSGFWHNLYLYAVVFWDPIVSCNLSNLLFWLILQECSFLLHMLDRKIGFVVLLFALLMYPIIPPIHSLCFILFLSSLLRLNAQPLFSLSDWHISRYNHKSHKNLLAMHTTLWLPPLSYICNCIRIFSAFVWLRS